MQNAVIDLIRRLLNSYAATDPISGTSLFSVLLLFTRILHALPTRYHHIIFSNSDIFHNIIVILLVLLFTLAFSRYLIVISDREPPYLTLGSTAVPWFFVDMARIASNIYKFRLPFLGGVYVLSDVSTMREKLLDKTSDYPVNKAIGIHSIDCGRCAHHIGFFTRIFFTSQNKNNDSWVHDFYVGQGGEANLEDSCENATRKIERRRRFHFNEPSGIRHQSLTENSYPR